MLSQRDLYEHGPTSLIYFINELLVGLCLWKMGGKRDLGSVVASPLGVPWKLRVPHQGLGNASHPPKMRMLRNFPSPVQLLGAVRAKIWEVVEGLGLGCPGALGGCGQLPLGVVSP